MKSLLSISTCLLTCSCASSTPPPLQDHCYAISLSGGGAKGAYEAGALWQLARSLPLPEISYDAVSGISAGAINAGWMTMYSKGDELAMTQDLYDHWKDLRQEHIYKRWTAGYAEGLIYRSGLYNSEPMVQLVRDTLWGKESKRNVQVGAVDAQTGQFVMFDSDTDWHVFPDAIIGSASVPGVFPYHQLGQYLLIDGSTAWNNNMVSVIDKCLQKVNNDPAKVTLDVIMLSPEYGVEQTSEMGATFYNVLRKRSIRQHYKSLTDLLQFMKAHPNINYRYLIQPEKTILSEYKLLDFSEKQNHKTLTLGKQDALKAIQEGPGVRFKKLQQDYQ